MEFRVIKKWIQFKGMERELKQMLAKLENYQHVAQIRIAATRERVQHEMVDKLSGLLWLFCASNNIVSIAEKNKILFCSGCEDYTSAFIDYLISQNMDEQ